MSCPTSVGADTLLALIRAGTLCSLLWCNLVLQIS
jgi:hypothetical protein